MSVQTTYGYIAEIGKPGMVANDSVTDTTTKSATGNIPFGLAVVRGATANKGKAPSASGDLFIGIALRPHTLMNPLYGERTGYLENEAMSLLRAGYVYVFPEITVAAGDPVFFRHTVNGGLSTLGALRNDGDSGNAKQIANAIFEKAGSTTTLAIVRIW